MAAVCRCQDGNGGGGPQPEQRFLLKWSVPLSLVEVLEFGSSEDMADSGSFPAAHSGEKVVINAKPSESLQPYAQVVSGGSEIPVTSVAKRKEELVLFVRADLQHFFTMT